MKRFIQPDELARDSRFVRQQNLVATLLSQLPDDPEKVAELFERLEPIIEKGVRGTAAEADLQRFPRTSGAPGHRRGGDPVRRQGEQP